MQPRAPSGYAARISNGGKPQGTGTLAQDSGRRDDSIPESPPPPAGGRGTGRRVASLLSPRSLLTAGTEPEHRGRGAGTFFPCFDGLRALAALLVVGVHTSFVSGFDGRSGLRNYTSRLEIGVEVFFVISGFLLYRPFAVDHFGGRPALPLKSFWARRLKRIIPAFWVAFIVVSYLMKADSVRHAWYSPFVYLGFAQIYSPRYVLTGITQAWSLCTEMSFYLLLPLYAALLVRKRRPGREQLRVEVAGLVALVAISFAYRIPVLSWHAAMAGPMPDWLPAYLDEFALGMLLAVASAWLAAAGRQPRWLTHPAMPWASWSLAALAFVAVSNIGLPWIPVTTAVPVGSSLARQSLYGVFAFFVVMPAVFGPQDRSLVRRLLRFRPVALVGLVSYGVYLWHQTWLHMYFVWTGDKPFSVPWIDALAAVVGLAVISATASYVLVERPVLRGALRLPGAWAPLKKLPGRRHHYPSSPAGIGS